MAEKGWTPERMAAARLRSQKYRIRESEGHLPGLENYPYEDRQELQRQGYASHEDPDTYD